MMPTILRLSMRLFSGFMPVYFKVKPKSYLQKPGWGSRLPLTTFASGSQEPTLTLDAGCNQKSIQHLPYAMAQIIKIHRLGEHPAVLHRILATQCMLFVVTGQEDHRQLRF